jgi:hypothetical protein
MRGWRSIGAGGDQIRCLGVERWRTVDRGRDWVRQDKSPFSGRNGPGGGEGGRGCNF